MEAVYQTALEHELTLRAIPFEALKRLEVSYKGQIVGDYIADLVVGDQIIPSAGSGRRLELKAVSVLNKAHEAQAHHYPSTELRTSLAATGLHLAILINPSTRLRAGFGAASLESKRVVK